LIEVLSYETVENHAVDDKEYSAQVMPDQFAFRISIARTDPLN
jgi:hypothetical protein